MKPIYELYDEELREAATAAYTVLRAVADGENVRAAAAAAAKALAGALAHQGIAGPAIVEETAAARR